MHSILSGSPARPVRFGRTAAALRLALALGCASAAGPGAAAAQARDTAAAAVSAAWAAYQRAARSGDGAAAASLVSRETIDYYDDTRRLALYGTAEEMRTWGAMERVVALRLRAQVPAERLRAMSARELFAYVTAQEWSRPRAAAPDEPTSIRVAGDFARVETAAGGTPLRFVREDGAWKWDVTPMLQAFNSGFSATAEQQGADPDSMFAELLARIPSPPSPRGAPPFTQPGGAGGRGSTAVIERDFRVSGGYREAPGLSDEAVRIYTDSAGGAGLFVAALPPEADSAWTAQRVLRRIVAVAAPAEPPFRWTVRPSGNGEEAREGIGGRTRLVVRMQRVGRDARGVLAGSFLVDGRPASGARIGEAAAAFVASLRAPSGGFAVVPEVDPSAPPMRPGESVPPPEPPRSPVTERRSVSLEGGAILLDVPNGLIQVPREVAERSFIGAPGTVHAFETREPGAYIAVMRVPVQPLPLGKLKALLEMQMAQGGGPQAPRWITRETIEVGGRGWVHLEFTRQTPDGEIHTHLLATPFRGETLMVDLGALGHAYGAYRDAFLATIQSLALRP